MSSDALRIAQGKLNEEKSKLDILRAEYDELDKQLQMIIRQDTMTGETPSKPTTSSPAPVASAASPVVSAQAPVAPAQAPVAPAPPPVPQIATSSADMKVKAADSYLAIDIWVQAKIKELSNSIDKSHIGTEANTGLVVKGNLRVKADKDSPDDNLLPTLQLAGGTDKYQRMVSSAGAGAQPAFPLYTGNNDCLIHAILTALSPSFRTLKKPPKDLIASYFRRAILLDIYNQLISERGGPNNEINNDFINNLNDLPTSNNLDTHIAGQLGIKYKIRILVRDRNNPVTKWNLEGNANIDTPYIIIYNPGQNHFEAVRFNPTTDNPNGIYIFNKNSIKEWLQQKEKLDRDETKLKCKIDGNNVENGFVIQYDKKLYSVIDVENNRDNTSCGYIYVVNYDNAQNKKSLNEILKAFNTGDKSHNVLNLVVNGKILEGCIILGNVTEHAKGITYSVG